MTKKKKEIKVCALILYPYNTTPGQRFRIEQWEPYLEKDGILIDYYTFADEKLMKTMPQKGKFFSKISGLTKAFFKRVSHLSLLSKYDVIFLYRATTMIGPAILERILKMSGRPIIYDFDDAIFLPHTHEANKLFSWAKFAGKTGSICRLSKAVTVGNSWLGEYAKKYNSNVTVIPSSVDTNIYLPKINKNNKKPVIGWTGSSTSQTHLEMFTPLLKEIIARREVEIHVHSDRSPDLPDIPFIWHKWTPENEVEIISGFDIGIMPMPDDEWSQGKCSMKALLYMAAGVPTVCSDIGMNREVIKHGENGFLAETSEEWIKYLEILIDNEDLRKTMGVEARKTVENNYSMTKCAQLFAQVVFQTVGK